MHATEIHGYSFDPVRLGRAFFDRPTDQVARELLGKVLVRKTGEATLSGVIVETEAYVGPHDLACHASKGRTPRTNTMFLDAGHWYVYLVYGMYHCLNIVTEGEGYPAAVLIRAISPLDGVDTMRKNSGKGGVHDLVNGPGKLCLAMHINKEQNATDSTDLRAAMYIEDRGIVVSSRMIGCSPRIGVDYAGDWKNKPLRFFIKNNPCVSRKKSGRS